jgi:hypothetical protein
MRVLLRVLNYVFYSSGIVNAATDIILHGKQLQIQNAK